MGDFLFGLLGWKSGQAIAGIAGGTTAAILTNGTWKQSLALISVGAVATPCVTPGVYFLLVYRVPFLADPSVELGLGFLIGLLSMYLCKGTMVFGKMFSDDPTILLRFLPWFRK